MCGACLLCLAKETCQTFASGESCGQCIDAGYAVDGVEDLLSTVPTNIDRRGSVDLAGGRYFALLFHLEAVDHACRDSAQPVDEHRQLWSGVVSANMR